MEVVMNDKTKNYIKNNGGSFVIKEYLCRS